MRSVEYLTPDWELLFNCQVFCTLMPTPAAATAAAAEQCESRERPVWSVPKLLLWAELAKLMTMTVSAPSGMRMEMAMGMGSGMGMEMGLGLALALALGIRMRRGMSIECWARGGGETRRHVPTDCSVLCCCHFVFGFGFL